MEGISEGSDSIACRITVRGVLCESLLPVTVYRLEGPHNVPDFSIHTYVSSVDAHDWSVEGGEFAGETGPRTANVLWGAGPVTGLLKFSPDPNFELMREVNVVEIVIQAPQKGVAAAFQAGTPFDGGMFIDDHLVRRKLVASGTPGLASMPLRN